MGARFIALRELKDDAGPIGTGFFVPGAEQWPHGIIAANVNCGNIYDLHRQFKLSGEATLASHRRERDLLETALRITGSVLIDDPDHEGRQILAPAGVGADAIDVRQTKTKKAVGVPRGTTASMR